MGAVEEGKMGIVNNMGYGNCKYGRTCRYKHEQNRNREIIGRLEKESENREETNIREKVNFLEEKIVDILDQVKQI